MRYVTRYLATSQGRSAAKGTRRMPAPPLHARHVNLGTGVGFGR